MNLIKITTIKKYSAVACLFLCVLNFKSSVLMAQSDYLVTIAGDTLRGEIFFSNRRASVEGLYYENANEKREYYTALETRAVWVDSAHFKIIKFLDKYRFMKVVTPGYLNILHFRRDGSAVFDQVLLFKRDGDLIELPRLNFKGQMSEFLDECDEVAIKIENRDWRVRDLDQIVRGYNDCIEARTAEAKGEIAELLDDTDSNEKNSAREIIVSLKAEFEASGMENLDFEEIIYDIERKIDNDQKIAAYLFDALKNSVNGSGDMLELIRQLESALK